MFVKICGITSTSDAIVAADAGASAIGLNFVPSSPRRVEITRARAIADAVRGRVEIFGVVADLDDDDLSALVDAAGIEVVQLHGGESPADVERVASRTGRRVVKAVRLGGAADLAAARAYPGPLLVDAKVKGALGGTGQRADWSAARELAAGRQVILAGGLEPENVTEAVAAVSPFGVDVASGVERAPGEKDPGAILRFVRAARGQ